jgi:hypothetical protein
VASSWCPWAIALRRKKIARVEAIAASDDHVAFEVRTIAVNVVSSLPPTSQSFPSPA